MERWLSFLKRYFWRADALDENLFNDLDLNKFLQRSLTLCLEESGAEEVYWILKSELDIIKLSSPDKDYLPTQELSFEHRLCGAKPFETQDVINNIRQFDLDSGGHQWHEDSLLFPIYQWDGREVLGYWLLKGIPEPRKRRVSSHISRLATRISKHLGFCIQYQSAKEESYLDDLTGLYNQKYMARCLENEIHRCSRSQEKFSVLFMDIDFFKSVNDTRGHWLGSRLLVDLGRVIMEQTRRTDYAFRYGGDEFVVVLTGADKDGAVIAAERLRKIVETTDFLIDGVQFNITLSIGIATYPDHAQSHKDIIQMADQAMYCGKSKSRNIVIMAS